MDNLTHGLVGALMGQAGLKRRTGLAMPALIIGANLPDIDAACTLYGVQSLALRRGLTHGPLAWVLLPVLLAGLLYAFDRWQARRGKRPAGRLPVHFGWLWALSFAACLTHPALDWLNIYGIRLLEPFSSRWFHGDVLFIIDIWLWLGMGLALWLSLRRERTTGGDWRKPARIALAAATAYIGVNAANTARSEAAVQDAPTGEDLIIAKPVPLNPFQRELVTGGEGLYAVNGTALPGVPLSACDLDRAAARNPDVRAFLFWSLAPFVEPGSDGILRLRDARFYDPLARDRFTVPLPPETCPGVR